ncbi:putative NBD/HSP70 family sugar kinase [Actinoplanes tereljensis]|uniref:Sugar kinase n=1 Tax=Paractinoplanes tereljensis TaxID=571912 RepID=A0A919NX22_9ACTN|nr:ROK family transcriptional regulator [Actinoplanes tereljensis]GIF26318.1 sugar kinase [Actinoplanes tereljensis]
MSPIGTRAHNLALALRHVAENPGAISRAGISDRTGLNRSTTSSLVDELIGGGLVREAGATTRSGVGRRGTALALRTDGPAGLGFDVAAEHAAACVVDLTGRVRFCRTAAGGRRAVGRLARSAVAAIGDAGLTLCGTEVAAGVADGLAGLRLPDAGRPVVLDSEANFAALAEDELLRAGESYLYVSGGHDIGAGLVVDGRLYRGRHGGGGDIGHVRVDPDGPACRCGRRGCLEQYAGPLALRSGPLDRAGTALGGVLAGYLNLLDLDRIVLGGIYRDLTPWLAPEIDRAIGAQFRGTRRARPEISAATYGAEAPALGAARAAVREVLADPLRWLTRFAG